MPKGAEEGIRKGMYLLREGKGKGGKKAKRVQLLGGRPFALPPSCAVFQGYNLQAGVGIGARDRAGLERLCRYVLHLPWPGIASSSLQVGRCSGI